MKCLNIVKIPEGSFRSGQWLFLNPSPAQRCSPPPPFTRCHSTNALDRVLLASYLATKCLCADLCSRPLSKKSFQIVCSGSPMAWLDFSLKWTGSCSAGQKRGVFQTFGLFEWKLGPFWFKYQVWKVPPTKRGVQGQTETWFGLFAEWKLELQTFWFNAGKWLLRLLGVKTTQVNFPPSPDTLVEFLSYVNLWQGCVVVWPSCSCSHTNTTGSHDEEHFDHCTLTFTTCTTSLFEFVFSRFFSF